jgi:hypothetical protein
MVKKTTNCCGVKELQLPGKYNYNVDVSSEVNEEV